LTPESLHRWVRWFKGKSDEERDGRKELADIVKQLKGAFK